jgi:hypothetical protein
MDATVRDVTLMTGAFRLDTAEGRRACWTFAQHSKDGLALHGSVEVSLRIDCDAGRSDFRQAILAGGGTTNLRDLLSARSATKLPYHFYDLHGHATYRTAGEWRIAVTGYGGNDVLDADLSEVDDDSRSDCRRGEPVLPMGNPSPASRSGRQSLEDLEPTASCSCSAHRVRRSPRTWTWAWGPRVSTTLSSTGAWERTSPCTPRHTSSRQVTSFRRIAWGQKMGRRRRASSEPPATAGKRIRAVRR